MLFFKAHVTGGPTSVVLGKNAHTGPRVPCEGDIRDLSPSLVDSLLLARSLRELCSRHRSQLAVPLGQGADEHFDGSPGYRHGEEEDGGGVGLRDTQLWVNNHLSDVSVWGFSLVQADLAVSFEFSV